MGPLGDETSRTAYVLAALTWDIFLIGGTWWICIEVLGLKQGIAVAAGVTVLIIVEAAFGLNKHRTKLGLARRGRRN